MLCYGLLAREKSDERNTVEYDMQTSTYCHADMYYMAPGGVDDVQAQYVEIKNGRERQDLSWEANGFQLMQHTCSVADWHSDAEIVTRYYPEMIELAKSLTGCDHALLSSHISRNPQTAAEHQDYAPIQFVHSDFTQNYRGRVEESYRRQQPETEAGLRAAGISLEQLLGAKRMLILQFWRNVGEVVMDLPLAFCDAQSVPEEDMRAIHVPNYADSGFAFDTYAVTPPRGGREHAWYTFPQMHVGEVVAFRTFDSELADSGGIFWTPHSAFADPTAPSDSPARESIEVRATCLFN